jgi:hypothetical protein
MASRTPRDKSYTDLVATHLTARRGCTGHFVCWPIDWAGVRRQPTTAPCPPVRPQPPDGEVSVSSYSSRGRRQVRGRLARGQVSGTAVPWLRASRHPDEHPRPHRTRRAERRTAGCRPGFSMAGLYALMVVMAVVTTTAAGPLLAWLLPRQGTTTSSRARLARAGRPIPPPPWGRPPR